MSKLGSLLACSLTLLQGVVAQDLDLPKKVVPVAPVLENTPLDPVVLEKSITMGVDFLLKTQNSDGSWGNATRTKGLNIYAPLPGAHHAFRMGTSSLALDQSGYRWWLGLLRVKLSHCPTEWWIYELYLSDSFTRGQRGLSLF